LPEGKSKEHIARLRLKLVYLITNPRRQTVYAASNPAPMTPDQLQQFRTLDFAARLQAIQQIQQQIGPQLDMLKVMMEGMTDEERIQMKVILSGGKREGGK